GSEREARKYSVEVFSSPLRLRETHCARPNSTTAYTATIRPSMKVRCIFQAPRHKKERQEPFVPSVACAGGEVEARLLFAFGAAHAQGHTLAESIAVRDPQQSSSVVSANRSLPLNRYAVAGKRHSFMLRSSNLLQCKTSRSRRSGNIGFAPGISRRGAAGTA